ncbi:hypothetical protein [Rhodanobacter sp. A1T4]|nr:hypothetical protein [Rhodanobacter sp. A1T4]MBB6247623.1 hypothetical protein [Rhodanobacter sp. A1T4]
MKNHTILRWCACVLLAIALLFAVGLWCTGSLVDPSRAALGGLTTS